MAATRSPWPCLAKRLLQLDRAKSPGIRARIAANEAASAANPLPAKWAWPSDSSRSAAMSGWRISDPKSTTSPRLGPLPRPLSLDQLVGEEAGRRSRWHRRRIGRAKMAPGEAPPRFGADRPCPKCFAMRSFTRRSRSAGGHRYRGSSRPRREATCSKPARRSGVPRSSPWAEREPQHVDQRLRRVENLAERLRTLAADQIVGILPSGQKRELDALPRLQFGERQMRRRGRQPSARPRRRRSRGSARPPSARASEAGLRSAPCRAARPSPRSRRRRRRSRRYSPRRRRRARPSAKRRARSGRCRGHGSCGRAASPASSDISPARRAESARPPKAMTRPRKSVIGKMMRSRKRSKETGMSSPAMSSPASIICSCVMSGRGEMLLQRVARCRRIADAKALLRLGESPRSRR